MHALSRAKNLINEYDARIIADSIYNRRKNNREPVITSSSVIDQFLIINPASIMQAPKKRDRSVKITTVVFKIISTQTFTTRRNERFMIT